MLLMSMLLLAAAEPVLAPPAPPAPPVDNTPEAFIMPVSGSDEFILRSTT